MVTGINYVAPGSATFTVKLRLSAIQPRVPQIRSRQNVVSSYAAPSYCSVKSFSVFFRDF